MIGSVPVDHICREKPTAVTYSSVFVVDLSCIRCIDDLCADDNGAWVHGGKPRKLMTSNLMVQGQTLSQSHLLILMESHLAILQIYYSCPPLPSAQGNPRVSKQNILCNRF